MTAAAQFRLPSTERDEIAWDDALAAVLGYARAKQPLYIKRTPSHPDGLTASVPKYAYGTYDCVPPSEDDGFAWLDVLVIDGLNGKLDQKKITALKDAADRAWPHVREAITRADGRPFWELPAEEVARRPPIGSAGEKLDHAWTECMKTPGVKVALTHKLLHHKRPDLFPLIDGRTAPKLEKHTDRDRGLWAVVHQELLDNDEQFTALEQTFAELVNEEGDVPLTRLRLHDIVLWLTANEGYFKKAVGHGRLTAEWQRWLDGATG